MRENLISQMNEKYQEYLIDESKFCGEAESISFPESEEEVVEIVKKMAVSQTPVTIQGGKTGIVGGAVPNGGHIMNLSFMNRCVEAGITPEGRAWITVEPGVNLTELSKEVNRIFRKTPVFWPPQPTETTATVGGILSSNAKGINACHYGDSRRYVQKIRMVCSDASVKEISERGKLEMLLGQEGILGAITQATLWLEPRPQSVWGITFFFEKVESAAGFAQKLKDIEYTDEAYLQGAEYLDRKTIDMIEGRKQVMTKIKEVPDIREKYQAMIYLELAGTDDAIEDLAESLMELSMEYGSDPDDAWAVSGETEVEKMHAFRHGAAETANLFIEEVRREDSRITKLGTDMVMCDRSFGELLQVYESGLRSADLQGCIFGHVLDNHLHVNILPENYEQYLKGRKLLADWASEAVNSGGCISGEHGIGKLKTTFTPMILSSERQALIRNLKETYDPINMWNRGNIFAL